MAIRGIYYTPHSAHLRKEYFQQNVGDVQVIQTLFYLPYCHLWKTLSSHLERN